MAVVERTSVEPFKESIVFNRRILLSSVLAAPLAIGSAVAQPWWDERARREEWERRRDEERRRREARHEDWDERREHEAWERRRREEVRLEWEREHRR